MRNWYKKIDTEVLLQIRRYFALVFGALSIVTVVWEHSIKTIVILLVCVFILLIDYCISKKLMAEIEDYSANLEKTIDSILLNYNVEEMNLFEESILSKNQIQLKKLSETMKKHIMENKQEKMVLQSLISDIAHQVKTPLANAMLYISALRKENVSVGKREKYLNILSEQISKLDLLIKDLLQMSRLENGFFLLEPRVEPIQDVLANALGSVAIKAEEKNIDVKVNCSENLYALYDRKWTSEALGNILDNAVKYTPCNGTVEINVMRYEIYSVIEIIDNGIGIAEEDIPQIFKRFYRGKNVRNKSGVGIGLYLAREIIFLEKGFIKVSSEREKGSKFSIFLLNQ